MWQGFIYLPSMVWVGWGGPPFFISITIALTPTTCQIVWCVFSSSWSSDHSTRWGGGGERKKGCPARSPQESRCAYRCDRCTLFACHQMCPVYSFPISHHRQYRRLQCYLCYIFQHYLARDFPPVVWAFLVFLNKSYMSVIPLFKNNGWFVYSMRSMWRPLHVILPTRRLTSLAGIGGRWKWGGLMPCVCVEQHPSGSWRKWKA